MKSTKVMLMAALAAGALVMGGSALQAKDSTNTPAGEHGHGMKGRANLAKQLDLTDAQKPKVEAIMKSATEKRKELRGDTSLTTEEKKTKGKALMEDTTKQLKAVLTPEQFNKWETLTKKGRHNSPPAGEKAVKE